jgi:hypothetical protein
MRLFSPLLLLLAAGCTSEDDVSEAIDAAAACSAETVCVSIGSYCPWGCNIVVDRDEAEAVWDAISAYWESHAYEACDQICGPIAAISCDGGRCTAVPAKTVFAEGEAAATHPDTGSPGDGASR